MLVVKDLSVFYGHIHALKGVSANLGLVKLSELVGDAYDRVGYLQDSEALSPRDKAYFAEVLKSGCSSEKLQFALANLARYLQKHHGCGAVLLLDEYDAPIISAWEHGYYGECIDFMRGF